MVDPDFSELAQDFPEVASILDEARIQPPTEAPGEHVWAAIVNALGGGTTGPVGGHGRNDKAGSSNGVAMRSRRSRGKTVAIAVAVAAALLLVAVPLALALG